MKHRSVLLLLLLLLAVPAIARAQATDNFNRANGDVGANWTAQINSLDVSSNHTIGHGASPGYTQVYWNAVAFANDQYSQAIAVTGATAYGGVAVRSSGTEGGGTRTAYYVLLGGGISQVYKVVNTTITALGSTFSDPANGDLVKIQVIGTTIKVFYNGVQQGSDVTDSAITSGSAGLLCYSNTAYLDDWQGGDTGGGGASASRGMLLGVGP